MKATDGLSFVSEILLLRVFSFLIALGGVVFGLLAFLRPLDRDENNTALTGFILYPIILPMFFPEFTRIGNDSLCLFLAGASAFFLMRGLQNEAEVKWSLGLGTTLGLGLLTKAFFLPITIAISVFLLIRIWVDRINLALYTKRWRNLFCVVFVALLIGSGWYVYKYIFFGNLIGSNDAIQLAQKGGWAVNLQQNFSAYAFVRGLMTTLVTWSWAGTWSLVRINSLLHIPLLLLLVWVIGEFLVQLKHRRLDDAVWLPVYMLVVFGFGFLWHIMLSIAINGNGNTPGWYLHILMPWVAPALGVGLHVIANNKKKLTYLILWFSCCMPFCFRSWCFGHNLRFSQDVQAKELINIMLLPVMFFVWISFPL
jgi:4-amino-4-deoxy-L-arabinose transferase-like glycosyltransferase